MKKEFLDLGKQPIANGFLNEGDFDITVSGLSQSLSVIGPPFDNES